MAKTLLMIHGVGCGGDVWDRMRAGFEDAGWTCEAPTLFPDLRTHEDPPAGLARLTFQDYVDDMARRCRQIEKATGERPAVIGHSMGGMIAQCLMTQGLVSKAVLLTPAQPKDCAKPAFSTLITFANILLSGDTSKGHKVWKFGFRYGVLNRVPSERHDEIYAGARYDSGHVYKALGDGIEIDEKLVQVPSMIIAAGKDRATPAKAVRAMQEKYGHAPVPSTFKLYPDNAHWIVDEPGTDQVTSDILGWLEAN